MSLTVAEGSQATMPASEHPTIGRSILLMLRKHQTKGLGQHSFLVLEGWHISPLCLLLYITLPSEPSQRWHFEHLHPGSAWEKGTAACSPGEVIPYSEFAKPKEASSKLKTMLWDLWLIFKREAQFPVHREVFSKIIHLNTCLGTLQFTNYFRHTILLDPCDNSVFLSV